MPLFLWTGGSGATMCRREGEGPLAASRTNPLTSMRFAHTIISYLATTQANTRQRDAAQPACNESQDTM